MVELKIITPHAVAIDTGWSGGNVGGVGLENFIVAIDTTKNYPKAVEFREALETHFNQPVKFAFLTHHHSDHAKGMDAFDKGSIISSKWAAQKVRNLTSVTNFPTITFDDSYTIEDGDLRVELHHSGLHRRGLGLRARAGRQSRTNSSVSLACVKGELSGTAVGAGWVNRKFQPRNTLEN